MSGYGAAIVAATAALGQAFTDIGITVTVARPTGASTVDVDTLARTKTETVLVVSCRAIVAQGGGIGGSVEAMPGQPRRAPVVRVLVEPGPDVDACREGDVITIATAGDPRMVGHRYRIVQVPDRPEHVARIFIVEPVPRPGGVL